MREVERDCATDPLMAHRNSRSECLAPLAPFGERGWG